MELHFTCPSCRKRLKVKGTAMGTQVACPGCASALGVPRDDFAPETRIAGYEILRPLGKGGMGEVYLARQLSMGREVALKVLSAEFASKPGAVERFVKEVHVAAKLEHSHIVTAYDAGQDDGLYFMAMTFIPGQSLAAKLKPGIVLSERDALTMTRKLAQALDYAWTRFHIIHRDIKPANILFDADGEPKLADMGLSKSLDEAEALTLSGAVMGTPNYMSPEQAEGASDLDLRADIYSLGATLYHAVTGQMPFAGSSIMAVLRKQAVEILPDPRQFNPALSEHFVGLLEIMLAKNRGDRYADWKVLLQDMDGVLAAKPPSIAVPAEGKSVLLRRGHGAGPVRKIVIHKEGLHTPHAPAAPAPRPAKKMSARDRALVIGGVSAVAVSILAAVLVTNLSRQRADERRTRADREARQAAADRDRESRTAAEKTQEEIWQVATGFAAAHSSTFDRVIANYEEAGKRLAGTKYELMAKNEIDRVRTAWTGALDQAFAELEARARERAGRREFEAAAEVFAKYNGAFADPLAERRATAEQAYRTAAAEAAEKMSQAERESKEKEGGVLEAIAQAVYSSDLAGARQACRTFIEDVAVTTDKSDMKRIAGWLDEVAAADRTLLATFEAQKGKTIPLTLDGDRSEVRISGVRNDRILVERRKGVGWAASELAPADIAPDEHYARLKDRLDPAALGLWAGMRMIAAKRPDLAARHFQAAGPLATALLAKAEGAQSGQREAAAREALSQALQAAGLPATLSTPGAVAERIQPGRIAVAQAAAALRQLDAYSTAFGSTSHAQSNATFLAVLRTSLEAAQKGVAMPVTPPPTAAKGDEFTQQVLAARTGSGLLVRVAPRSGNGCLEASAALAALKPGTQFRYTAAPEGYSLSASDVHTFDKEGVIVEAETGAGHIRARISGANCVVRGVPRIHLRAEKARRLVVTDSVMLSLDVREGSDVLLHNCVIVGRVGVKPGSRLEARNCTFVALGAGEVGFGLEGDLVLRDCVVVAAGFAICVSGERRVEVRNSIVHGDGGAATVVNSSWSSPPGSYRRLNSVGAIPRVVVDNCNEKKPALAIDRDRMIFRLAEGSPGRGALPGGKDLGADIGADGLPVWSGRPAALATAAATPGLAGGKESSSTGGVAVARQTIDLLALCDPELDLGQVGTATNRWTRQEGAWVCAVKGPTKLLAPVGIIARSHELEVEFDLLSGPARLNMDMVFDAERVIPMYIDGAGRKHINGKAGSECPESPSGRQRIVVRLDRGAESGRDRIRVWLEGRLLTDWQGDAASYTITLDRYRQFGNQYRPALYVQGSIYRIHAWTLRLFDGEARMIRPTPASGPTGAVAAAKAPGAVYTNAVGGEMVALPPGEFMMGSTPEEREWAIREMEQVSPPEEVTKARTNMQSEGARPARTRIAKSFWIGRTEVTVAQFRTFATATRYVTAAERKGTAYAFDRAKGTWGTISNASWRDAKLPVATTDSHPATCITWTDADGFCQWLDGLERAAGRVPADYRVRLPTEAEWEYACRGGRQGSRFWWGDSVADGASRLNWLPGPNRSSHAEQVDHYGLRGRNGFGLADMLGNVREWCLDGFDPAGPHEEPYLADVSRRVLRGGAFGYNASMVRCASRDGATPADTTHVRYGFRIVCGPDRPFR